MFSAGQSWAHSVVGAVADYDTNLIYIEAGSQKGLNGQRHPYMNVRNKINLARSHVEATAENLDPGEYVEYEVFQAGPGSMQWLATWNGNYFTGTAQSLGTTGFRYMISGLEASCSGCNMGYVALQNNQYNSGNGVWKRWCYSSHTITTKGSFSNPQPTVSVCYGGNSNSWNMLYH